MTRLYGIVGWPITHSRSPAMHNEAFAALHLDAKYLAFGVRPSKLRDAIRGLAAIGVKGFNVTIPYKQSVMPLLDRVDEDAAAIGAVNTVVNQRGVLHGFNTDAPGLVRALEEHKVRCKNSEVVVVGAGGAARAAVAGLLRAGAKRVTVSSRRKEQADELLEDLQPLAGKAKLESFALEKTPQRCYREAALLVQSSSATMDDGPEAHVFAERLPIQLLPKKAVVTDLVYSPRETTVLRAASKRGLQTVDGLGMLLHQGAIAFERWTKKKAPVDVMRKALE